MGFSNGGGAWLPPLGGPPWGGGGRLPVQSRPAARLASGWPSVPKWKSNRQTQFWLTCVAASVSAGWRIMSRHKALFRSRRPVAAPPHVPAMNREFVRIIAFSKALSQPSRY